jgi:hypothetical protein
VPLSLPRRARHTLRLAPGAKPHGRFLAAKAGEIAGVSGTTIGQ